MEITPIGRHHGLLTEFRRAFKSGLLPSDDPARPLLPIEGPRLIGEAIRSGYRVEKVLFSHSGLNRHGDKLLPQFSRHVAPAVADDGDFAAAMDVEHPQGVAVMVRYPLVTVEALFGPGSRPANGVGRGGLSGAGERAALVVAAAEMQDPGNLGTLIRAADAFGATGFAALADTVSPFNPKAVRASAGSLFHLPIAARLPAAALISACQARGVRLLAASARGGANAAAADLASAFCLIIGQEGGGVPRELQRAATSISIPMAEVIESLNAGVAGSVLLYEAARQRHAAGIGATHPQPTPPESS